MGLRTKLISGVAAVALASVAASPVAWAGPEKVTPESAQEARAPLQDQSKVLDEEEAGPFLAGQGRTLGDPTLLLDAAAAYKIDAEARREIPAAEAGIGEARLALDILHFLGDERADAKWKPLTPEEVDAEIGRAEGLISASEALIEEIIAEQEAANAPPPEAPPPEKKGLAPGTGMMIGGTTALTVGLGGVAVGVVGIVQGRNAQSDVEDPDVMGSALDDADRRGKNANIMAYTGFAVGAVGIGVGTALLVLGAKKRKEAGQQEEASAMVVPTPNGLLLTGRF